jgi:hypothetical protein
MSFLRRSVGSMHSSRLECALIGRLGSYFEWTDTTSAFAQKTELEARDVMLNRSPWLSKSMGLCEK